MPFLPVFFILACPAIDVCLTKVKESVWFADLHIQTTRSIILAGIIISNAMSFCIVSTSFSAAHIRRHDQVLSMILQGIRNHFPSQSTVILGQQLSTFSGYRHVQNNGMFSAHGSVKLYFPVLYRFLRVRATSFT
jgi:hypothetical protein